MVGVTFFGIFLTPVFFYVIRRHRPSVSSLDVKEKPVLDQNGSSYNSLES